MTPIPPPLAWRRVGSKSSPKKCPALEPSMPGTNWVNGHQTCDNRFSATEGISSFRWSTTRRQQRRTRRKMAELEQPARSSIFVGSSSEGVEFARAVRSALESDAEVTVWDEGVFELGQTFVESLTQALSHFDFAVLVLTPDDVVQSRSAELSSPRDNVIFELGLFMGKLGRGRTFILQRSHSDLKVPSDLSGITTAQYYWPRTDGNYRAAVATACDSIRRTIRSLGVRSRDKQAERGAGLDLSRVRERGDVLWTSVNGCEVQVVNGRIEDYSAEDTTTVVLPCTNTSMINVRTTPRAPLGRTLTRCSTDRSMRLSRVPRMNAERDWDLEPSNRKPRTSAR